VPKSRPDSTTPDPGSCGAASGGVAEGGARPDPERSSSRRPSGAGATLDDLRQRLERIKYEHAARGASVGRAVRSVADSVAAPGEDADRQPADADPVPAAAVPDRTDEAGIAATPDAARRSFAGARRQKTEGPPDPYRKALGLLVRREHSRRELKRKLGVRGVEPDAVDAALDTLQGQGYQDEARFAEMLVRSRIGGGYGPLYIRAELGTHGMTAEAIAKVFSEAGADWPALARDALRRRYGTRPATDRAETIKRAHFLQRRGFDLDSIRAATAADLDD
jgi:regulatory protein